MSSFQAGSSLPWGEEIWSSRIILLASKKQTALLWGVPCDREWQVASRTREAKFYNCKEQCSVQQPVSLKAEPEPQVRSQTFETLSGELSYTGPRFLTHRIWGLMNACCGHLMCTNRGLVSVLCFHIAEVTLQIWGWILAAQVQSTPPHVTNDPKNVFFKASTLPFMATGVYSIMMFSWIDFCGQLCNLLL